MSTYSSMIPHVVRFREPSQIAWLVPDIEAAISRWGTDDVASGRQWRRYLYDQDFLAESTYRGAPGAFSMRLALLGSSPQIELIQPLAGPSIYHDWVDQHGYGFHHLGYFVDDLAGATGEFVGGGYPVAQSGCGYGLHGDGAFAYFDLSAQLGVWIELIEVPSERRAPIASFN